jgi:hypothetical protein
MQMIIDYARAEGVQAIEGQVLRENTTMLAMCKEWGSTTSLIQTMSSLHREAYHVEKDRVYR